MKITVAILAMAAGGLAVKQFIKINKGKEALREIGHQAMPVDEYSISPGEKFLDSLFNSLKIFWNNERERKIAS